MAILQSYYKLLFSYLKLAIYPILEIIKTHPYFFANLPILFIILVIIIRYRHQDYHRVSLLSGLVCLPGSVLGLLHNGTYWNPVRLGGMNLGIEDFMFTFIIGVLTWLCAAFPYRKKITFSFNFNTWIFRFSVIILLFFMISGILWTINMKSLENSLISLFLAFFLLPFIFQKNMKLAISGLLSFIPVYLTIVKVQYFIWPGYIHQWNSTGFLGGEFAGLPSGEIWTAFVLSISCPIFIAYTFNIKIQD